MGQDNVDDMRLMLEEEPAARAKLVNDRNVMLELSADQLVSAFPP
jgi:hypothetical protein